MFKLYFNINQINFNESFRVWLWVGYTKRTAIILTLETFEHLIISYRLKAFNDYLNMKFME